jgi:hypothetical protein
MRRTAGRHPPPGTHRTRIVFTARFDCSPGSALYIRATVTLRGAGKARRWRSAIALVAALGLFAAVTTGWASRTSSLAGTGLPQPAALSQVALHVGADAAHVHIGDQSRPTSHVGQGFGQGFSVGSSPTHQKPTKNAWMTRDRPPTWTRLSAQSVRSPLPASFAASGLQPGAAQAVAQKAGSGGQDILTELCVARR